LATKYADGHVVTDDDLQIMGRNLWNLLGVQDDFDAAERSVLAFTEIYAQGPEFITDELATEITGHFGDAGLVCLIEALGFIDARIRLALVFNRLQTGD
jgi:hypothetical protein